MFQIALLHRQVPTIALITIKFHFFFRSFLFLQQNGNCNRFVGVCLCVCAIFYWICMGEWANMRNGLLVYISFVCGHAENMSILCQSKLCFFSLCFEWKHFVIFFCCWMRLKVSRSIDVYHDLICQTAFNQSKTKDHIVRSHHRFWLSNLDLLISHLSLFFVTKVRMHFISFKKNIHRNKKQSKLKEFLQIYR